MLLCPFNHFFFVAELELVKLNWIWVKISLKKAVKYPNV